MLSCFYDCVVFSHHSLKPYLLNKVAALPRIQAWISVSCLALLIRYQRTGPTFFLVFTVLFPLLIIITYRIFFLIYYSPLSQAYVAKLETTISVVGSKLEITLFGYNDKLPILLSNILSTLQSFSPKTDRFEVMYVMWNFF